MLFRFLYILIFSASTSWAGTQCGELFRGPLFFKEGRWLKFPAEDLKSQFLVKAQSGYSIRLYRPNEYMKSYLKVEFADESVRAEYRYMRDGNRKLLKEYILSGVLQYRNKEWVFVVQRLVRHRPQREFKDNQVIFL